MLADTAAKMHKHRVSSLCLLSLLAVVCLLAGNAAGQQYPAGSCLAQNPLIRMLSRYNVQVFEVPKSSNSKICSSEWKQHLTCCDSQSLSDYAEEDIKQLNKAMKNVKRDVVKMRNYINKYEEEIEKAIKKSNMKEKREFIEQLNKDLKSFKRELKSVLDKEKKSEDEKDECFERIKEIRTNSLCYTCSGRSEQYFLKGLAKISSNDCRKTIDKCGDTWRKSIDLVDAIVLAKRIRKQLKEVIPDDDLMDFDDGDIKKFRTWIGSEEIRKPIRECDGKPNDCSEPSAILLCETFISLRKHGVITDLGGMIDNKKPAPQPGAPGWQIGGGSRRLQFSGRKLMIESTNPQSVIVTKDGMPISGSAFKCPRDFDPMNPPPGCDQNQV